MTVEEFRQLFKRELAGVSSRVTRQYSISEESLVSALFSTVKKYLRDELNAVSADPKSSGTDRKTIGELLESLNIDDLVLAIACAGGVEVAWEDFFRDYRGYLISIARTMTQDACAAEQLADSTFAELYGLRESEVGRVSKFTFYSGRGSLRGWLRAVVYQLSADMYRQTSRFVQPEEDNDLDRMASSSMIAGSETKSIENSISRERYAPLLRAALQSVLSQLETREKLLLAYYYFDEMTLKEIGEVFEVHEATVCRRIARAQKRIRKLVEKMLANECKLTRRQISDALELATENMELSVKDYLVEPSSTEPESRGSAKHAVSYRGD